MIAAGGCRSGTPPTANPVVPSPVTPPGLTADHPSLAGAPPTRSAHDIDTLPTRPEQAPLATVREIVDGKVSLGRRVRVRGHCTTAGTGRMAGFWTLADSASQIEVRGLVPHTCPGPLAEHLTIFAQVEGKIPGKPERILLRLPG